MITVEGKNAREKVFYNFFSLLASAKKYKAFTQPDGVHGQDGSMTNWESSDGRLPTGHAMMIQKIGFAIRPKAGVASIDIADLSKLQHGTYSVKKGELELKSGTLAEFFSPVIKDTTNQVSSNILASPVMTPLMQEELWTTEPLTFEVSVPAVTVDKIELSPLVKGVYES